MRNSLRTPAPKIVGAGKENVVGMKLGRSNRRNRAAEFVQPPARGVDIAPMLDVSEIQFPRLDAEDVSHVVPVFIPVPAQFLDDHVLGCRDPGLGLQIRQKLPDATRKSFPVMRIGAETKEFDDKGGIFQVDDLAAGAGNRFEGNLVVDCIPSGSARRKAANAVLSTCTTMSAS
jgi:hypothetical protein